MKISHKLILSFMLVATLASVAAFLTIRSYWQIDEAFALTANQPEKIAALNDLRQAGLRIASSAGRFVVSYFEGLNTSGDAGPASDQSRLDELAAYQEALTRYGDLVRSEANPDTVWLQNIESAGHNLIRSNNEIIELKKQDVSGTEVLDKQRSFESDESEYLKQIDAALAQESKVAKRMQTDVHATIDTATRQSVIAALLTFLLAIGLGVFISLAISRRLKNLKDASEKVGSGDLETQIEILANDEIGDLAVSFNKMAANLKLSGDTLRDSETQHRQLFENNPFPTMVFERETLAILAVNEAAIRHYGYSRDEFAAMNYVDIWSAEKMAAQAGDAADVLTTTGAADVQKHRRKDGTTIDVEITSTEVVFDGRPAMFVLAYDITERSRFHAESQAIAEIMHGATTTSNLDELLHLIHRSIGRLIYAENCFVTLYDAASEMLNIQFFVDQVDEAPASVKMGRGLTAYIYRTGVAKLMTVETIRELTAAGEVEIVGTVPAAWLGVPLRTPNGVTGVLVVQHYSDPNAYSQRDVELLNAVAAQIALVIERKGAEEQLALFNEKLQQSNRELQDFAYVASHDLQEPLRKVQAFSDRLKTKYGDRLEGDGLDYIERMRNAAQRMQLLIQDLLTFSRVSSKGEPFSPVDLETITREVLSDLEVKIDETGAAVELVNLPTLDADPMQMRQLMQNLIGNALKFQRKDCTPTITIGSQMMSNPANGSIAGKQFCNITIKDNGIGFDEKYTDKIFAVFQRLHGRSEYEGSGVGLSVCRKIVERHSGSITATSAPGEGATFTISLPVKQANMEITQ